MRPAQSIFLLLFLLGGWTGIVPVFAQIAGRNLPQHTCTHHCASVKTLGAHKTGIYTQDERVHHYNVKFYGLDLEVNPASTFVNGSVAILLEVTEPDTRFIVLELYDDHTVSAIYRDEVSLDFAHTSHVLEIDLGEPVASATLMQLEIHYQGEPQPEGFFSGIQTAVNSFGDPVLWTLSEPHNARQWFPCKQVLSDKADSVYVFITTPPGFIAASNGLLHHVEEFEDGRLQYQWKSYYPIAYYLISMAVANYQEYSFFAPMYPGTDSVLVQNFLYNYPEVLESQKDNIDQTRPMMQLLTELWGKYPFSSEKYGHAQASMGGGMEHQTISTMGYFGFDITAHELAHHWFGNNVTCATWSDIWINEGFASYGEYLAREFIIGAESAHLWMAQAHANVKSQPDGSVYIPPVELGDVWRIFNGRLSYKKGAAILHQLRFEINNDNLFFYIMQDFQNTFADSVASGDDFRTTVDQNTGESWEWFFDQWYYGEGFPVFEIKWWQKNDSLFIRSSQNTSASHPSFFAGTLEFMVITQEQEQIIRVFQEQNLQTFSLPAHQKVENLIFDPGGFMLMDYSFWDSTQTDMPQEQLLRVFPNPVSDFVYFSFAEEWHNAQFHVTNMQGRILLENKLTSKDQKLNLTQLANGIYFIVFISEKGERKSFKILKL